MTATIDHAPSKSPGLLRTSNGKKAVMAVSGAILVLYLVAHMLGNLKIFLGAEAFNGYAEWLRTVGEPAVPGRTVLTLTEVVLTAAVALHIWSAVSLARRAGKARPVKYVARASFLEISCRLLRSPMARADRYATHIMRYGGLTIALFVVWHLLDLTFGVVNPAGGAATPYDRVVDGFDPARWYVTVFYVLAVIMVGLHLRHGIWSAFQTLGLTTHRTRGRLRVASVLVSAALVLGFLSVPVAVMIGVVK